MTLAHFSLPARTVAVDINRGLSLGHWDVSFESEAIPGTLAAFAGVLALNRLDISSAIMQRRPKERVRDTFTVIPLPGAMLGPGDAERLAYAAGAALRGELDVAAAIQTARREGPEQPAGRPAHVVVCADSEFTTGVTVRAADRLGLLYDITSTLTRHGMRTRAITVLTYGDAAHDSFHVVDELGMPISDERRLELVRTELMRVCGT